MRALASCGNSPVPGDASCDFWWLKSECIVEIGVLDVRHSWGIYDGLHVAVHCKLRQAGVRVKRAEELDNGTRATRSAVSQNAASS